jgi:hypothetical protein
MGPTGRKTHHGAPDEAGAGNSERIMDPVIIAVVLVVPAWVGLIWLIWRSEHPKKRE